MKPKKLQNKFNLNKSTIVSLGNDSMIKVKGGETEDVATLCLPICSNGCGSQQPCTVSCRSCGGAQTCFC